MALVKMGIQLTYANIDIIELAESYEFDIQRPTRIIDNCTPGNPFVVAGIPTWSFKFLSPRCNIPDQGSVELVARIYGSVIQCFAEGTACISEILLIEDFGRHYQYDRLRYILRPLHAPLVFPDEVKRRADIATEKEKALAELKLAVQATMAQFEHVSGNWSVKGRRHYVPYERSCASMIDAIGNALSDIEWNEACPTSIECDGVEIFDRDDLFTIDYDALMEAHHEHTEST